ncbi:MAG: methyltransferase domain-containing protein [Parcubacteria group bacterium]|nr:methyltransferase domain-containing protein [Parcubacteria group bacterium]
MTHTEALTKAYGVLSPYSDKQRWEFNNNLVHLLHITKHIPKESAILDVGCGIGILDVALILLGYNVMGVDKYMFEPNNTFGIRDIEGLKAVWEEHGLSIVPKDILRDDVGGTYGAVISIATIEHQKDPKRFLGCMLDVLEPAGLLYIATPNISHLLNRIRLLFGRSPVSGHLPNFFNRGENYEGHWREYTLSELAHMFDWLGVSSIQTCNVQSMRIQLSLASVRSWYVSLFRMLAYMIPGTRDTNIIIGRKQ